MNTAEQRLTNLTARVDQLEAHAQTTSRISTILLVCMIILAGLLIAKATHA